MNPLQSPPYSFFQSNQTLFDDAEMLQTDVMRFFCNIVVVPDGDICPGQNTANGTIGHQTCHGGTGGSESRGKKASK